MLTVITPCFNSERFIARCVETLAGEIGDLPVEHLVIDGASKDRTLEILAGYRERYPHLRVVSEPDRGQSDAMNKGIALARHRTISFLNVDDFYEPGTLAAVLPLLREAPDLYFLVGNCHLRSLDGQVLAVNRPWCVRFERLMLQSSLFPFPSNPSAYFYDRRLHEVVGPYEVGLRYTMDLEFILRASRVAAVRHVDAVWGNFVLHADCKTASATSSGAAEMARFMQRFRATLTTAERLRLLAWRVITEPYRWVGQLIELAKRVRGRVRRTFSPAPRSS
jgi:glycosyltransferase involved in cell wall biosynthesis